MTQVTSIDLLHPVCVHTQTHTHAPLRGGTYKHACSAPGPQLPLLICLHGNLALWLNLSTIGLILQSFRPLNLNASCSFWLQSLGRLAQQRYTKQQHRGHNKTLEINQVNTGVWWHGVKFLWLTVNLKWPVHCRWDPVFRGLWKTK